MCRTPEKISQFILQCRSSKDLITETKILQSTDTSVMIGQFTMHFSQEHWTDLFWWSLATGDEGHFYTIDFLVVTKNGERHSFSPLTTPIPGPPDAPKLWLGKISDTNFSVEWSEPKTYGLPVRSRHPSLYNDNGSYICLFFYPSMYRSSVFNCLSRVKNRATCSQPTNFEQRSRLASIVLIKWLSVQSPIILFVHNQPCRRAWRWSPLPRRISFPLSPITTTMELRSRSIGPSPESSPYRSNRSMRKDCISIGPHFYRQQQYVPITFTTPVWIRAKSKQPKFRDVLDKP